MKWEYKSINVQRGCSLSDEELNELGADRWEIVFAEKMQSENTSWLCVMFKRQLVTQHMPMDAD